jgi:hypothetical protein
MGVGQLEGCCPARIDAVGSGYLTDDVLELVLHVEGNQV